MTVPETVQTAVQTFAAYPTTRMTIVFQDSSIAVIEISRKDTYVQGMGNTQVTSVAIMANSELYFDTNVILPNVKISKGVTHIDLNATIKNVVIESSDDIHITGSGDFENVTVSTNKTVDFAAKGSIGNLNMENGTGTVELGNELNVSNVTLPPGKTANEVISNFEGVKDKIEKVDNVDNPAYIPGQVPENPNGHFTAGVSKVEGRYGYVSLNVKNQGSYEVKYLQKDRFVTPPTNPGAIGQQVPKGAVSFKDGDQIIQYYGHELFVYQVDAAGTINDMKELDDHTIAPPRYELVGRSLTVTVPMIPKHLSNYGDSTNLFITTENFAQSFADLTEDKWTKVDGLLSITLRLNGDVKGITKVITDFPSVKFMSYLNRESNPVTEKLLLNELYLLLKFDQPKTRSFYIYDSMHYLACGYYGDFSNMDDRCKEPDFKPFQSDSLSMATYRQELLRNELSITTAIDFKRIIAKVDLQLKDKVVTYIKADKQVTDLFKDDFYQYDEGNQLKPETTQRDIDTARLAVNQVSDEFTEKMYLNWLLDTAGRELSGESGR
ncbi:hypothetical protein PGH26_02125 [Sporosarcina jeotgali]|uniref:Uncharacterized protein n=1 Tax=Sporosarcina jeotgali TaxID=3020056 RepID=A0ABZ0KWH1_9BACL|nr:hypothetical protein [Sporosarcina sp. B2O-1]WOV84745.1 hypothetical protein PGH26_02125 [Sporosarcina sp. B2O-1]